MFPNSLAAIASSKAHICWDRTAYMDTTSHFTGPSWHKSQTDTGCCFRAPVWRRGIDFFPVLLPQVIYSFNLIGRQELSGSDVYWDMRYVLLLPSDCDSRWPDVSCPYCWQSTFWSRGNNVPGKIKRSNKKRKRLQKRYRIIQIGLRVKFNLNTQHCFICKVCYQG